MHFFGNVTLRVHAAGGLSLGAMVGVALWLGGMTPALAESPIGSCSRAIALAQAPVSAIQLAQGVERPLGLKFDPVLNLEPSSSSDTPVYIFGKDVAGQTDDLIEARGQAEFRKLGLFIKGDYIRHDLVHDEVFAQGQVKLFREGEFYEGPTLRLKLGTTQGFFDDVRYQLVSTGGQGTAKRAEFIQPLETRLTQAVYSTCPRDRPAWSLRMDELLIDQIREVGASKSSTLYWGETPIVPFGDVSFPIGDLRKTGWLPPSYSN